MRFRQYTPQEWIMEIEGGLEFRRKFGIEAVWGEMEAIYYNVHPSMANDGPNVIMSTGDALLSTLTVPSPRFLVKPERQEAVSKARQVESLDNLLLRELGIRQEVDTIELHAFLFGVGIGKIGFDSEYGFDPKLDVGGTLRLGFTLTQLDEQGTRRIEHDSTVAPGMPWMRAVLPHDIIVPWGTLNLSNCPWIIHRFVRQIDDLKADKKYTNTQRLSPTLSMEDFVQSYKSTVRLGKGFAPMGSGHSFRGRSSAAHTGSREVQYIELYEIHDRRTGRIFVVTPDHDSFLRNDINALQIENRLPFVATSFTPKSRSFWTTSDAYYLRAAQMELSDLAVQRTKIRRLAVLKFLYDGDAIDEAELSKLLSPDIGAAAKITTGQDIDKAIKVLQTSPDQTLVLEEEHLRRNVREQVGFSRNQLGEFSGGRRTATEASIVDNASALRMTRRGLAVKRLYEDIIEVINGIVFEHWTLPRYIEVLGESGAKTWQEVTGPGLKSRYSYEVVFGDDSEVRRRRMEALQLYQLLSQDPSIDPVALRQYLSDQFNDPEFTRLFNADIQNAMRSMRIAGGLAQPQSGNRGGGSGAESSGMRNSGLSGANGQDGLKALQGLLAGGGSRT